MFKNSFQKIASFMRQCGKIQQSRTGHRWKYNTEYAFGVLNNYDYRHTHNNIITYCFSMATIVARMRRIVTFHVHCLSCYSLFAWIRTSLETNQTSQQLCRTSPKRRHIGHIPFSGPDSSLNAGCIELCYKLAEIVTF